MPDLNDDQFDNVLSPNEQAKISGKAIAGHLWRGFTNIMGGEESMRQDARNDAWTRAADLGFPINRLHERSELGGDESDSSPVWKTEQHGYEFRHSPGGPYIDMHHPGEESPVDSFHISEDDKSKRTHQTAQDRITSWMDYLNAEE
jgi:hypothetical protein